MACISRFDTAILSGETELALGTIRVKSPGEPPMIQMQKREWSAESNGKLLHLFTPGKTAVDDLPSAELQPRFLPLGRTLR